MVLFLMQIFNDDSFYSAFPGITVKCKGKPENVEKRNPMENAG